MPEVGADSIQTSISKEMQDDRLFSQMRKVGGWLDQYCEFNRRFPEQGDEMTDATQQLNDLVPNNPYDSGMQLARGFDVDPSSPNYNGEDSDALPDELDVATKNNRITLQIDPSLTELDAQEYVNNPPYDWRAAPGMITVISNQQNLFVIWGANRKGRPIKDPSSGRAQLVIGRYRLLN